jgi:hypothetical protein
MAGKGLLLLVGIFIALMGLLFWAKSQPAKAEEFGAEFFEEY